MGFLDLFRRAASDKRRRPVVIKRGYDAASADRLNFSWTAGNACADDDLLRALDKLRARSRDLAYNNEYAKKYLQMVVTHIVGPNGFNLQNLANDFGKPDELARQVIEQAFDAWSRKGVCEIGGQYAFQELQRQIIRAVARDGEALVLKVRGKDAGNAYGYALRLIEIDRLPASYNCLAKNGNRIIMGVEVDAIGKPVAYHVNFGDLHLSASSLNLTRIAASEILHIFHAERAEQHRGAPWMHAIMGGLKQLGAYSESAIVASRVGASKMGFFTTPDGDPAALAGGQDDQGEFLTDADPGTFGVLPAGYDFKSFDPDYPQANYDSFVKSCLRGISSGLGVSYNTLANDLEGVNFSSIRSGVLEERDNWIVLQNWFIEAFMRPVFNDWINYALTAGEIRFGSGSPLPIQKLEKFSEHAWQGRRWQWVDPLKDLNSSILAIENGLASPQSIAASMGVDVSDVLDQIKQFQDMVSSKGVTLGSQTEPAPVPAPMPPEDPSVKIMEANSEMLRHLIQRDQRPAPQPQINVHQAPVTVNLPEIKNILPEQAAPQVEVHVEAILPEQAAPQVEVNVEAVMPEQTAPVVNVTNEVQPAEVNVNLPARKTETTVVRDAKGNISTATQIETDL